MRVCEKGRTADGARFRGRGRKGDPGPCKGLISDLVKEGRDGLLMQGGIQVAFWGTR